ncbi:uncharacterized protein LOC130930499 [Corythoichthys intestinalis]|uniref:uncharacterized protein LOC130930499 n=1 Tax=Corythoichthys intestinalis TaxID=161448 RepID=UPI0025A53954|nr:uncharacterized protein LOC130930499 [Corythoichthys intestinalis]XP_057714472.1 uncharacterized protein LOC130930499 [Corythoichthys intestinalis]
MSFDKFGTFTMTPVGRGRGLHSTPVSFSMSVHGNDVCDNENIQSHVGSDDVVVPGSPLVDDHRSPHIADTSVPVSAAGNAELVSQMSSIIQQLGRQIADSILSQISASTPAAAVPSKQEVMHEKKGNSPSHTLDLSHVQLVTQRAVKDPPVFRGEDSDTLSIDDWEEGMRDYVRKSNVQIEDQAEEILMHLRGRAKDVVRFGIRNGEVDVQNNPEAIYGLLRKHFSSSRYSSVPLADFYSTFPYVQEDAYEYWLRLNRAADVAASCLKDQGKTFDNPSVEVARMFIRHCPNRDLAFTFRSKTIDKWSSREVQEVLDEYHLEKGNKSSTGQAGRVNVNKVEVALNNSDVSSAPEQPAAVSQDTATLERLIGMLEKVLLKNSGYTQARRNPRNNAPSRIQGLNDTPCSICNDSSHSAFIHCRENNLCFLCHAPGHSSRFCSVGMRRPSAGQQGN